MVTQKQNWSKADFVGGHPALDFLNTVADPEKSRELDRIADWPQFLGWMARAGLADAAEGKELDRRTPGDPSAILADLHRLRKQAYALMCGIADGAMQENRLMEPIERRVRIAITRARFVSIGNRFEWRPGHSDSEYWADTITLSLECLLRSDDLKRVRQCARCTWFFIDQGRGAGRRWCDMRTCGNRAKAQAFRRR